MKFEGNQSKKMGFGLNLGIPDPRQWKRQQVPHAIVDEHRVSQDRCWRRMLETESVDEL